MHPFLKVDFNSSSSTVDMINQLSNDTLQNINIQDIEHTFGTAKYADSGVDSHVNLEQLVTEIELEMQQPREHHLSSNVSSNAPRQQFKTVQQHVSRATVPRENVAPVHPVHPVHSMSREQPTSHPVQRQPQQSHPFVSSDASFTSSVVQSEYLSIRNKYRNDIVPNDSISHVHRPPSSVPSSILSPKIKQVSIVSGSETIQLEQGMNSLLRQYGLE